MTILIEDKLIEMAKMHFDKVPQQLIDRTRRIVIDQWVWDRSEQDAIQKLAFEYSLGISFKPFHVVDFYYGFTRGYKYVKGGKATGANNAPKYVFRALHIISNVPGGEGQWYRNDFKDEDFDGVVAYENDINLAAFNGETMKKIVKGLNLKVGQQNILTILDRLL
jgi:hypothetical protein